MSDGRDFVLSSEEEALAIALEKSLIKNDPPSGPASLNNEVKTKIDPALFLAQIEDAEIKALKKIEEIVEKKKREEAEKEKSKLAIRKIEEFNDSLRQLCLEDKYEEIRLMILDGKVCCSGAHAHIIFTYGSNEIKNMFKRFGG